MRPAALITAVSGIVLIAFAAVLFAVAQIGQMETSAERQARASLTAAGQSWAGVQADGLRLVLQGTAPDEAARIKAQDVLAQVFGADLVDNEAAVAVSKPPEPPVFQLEILRNHENISIFGLIPQTAAAANPAKVAANIAGSRVVNLVEQVNWDAPAGWADAVDFALNALEYVPLSKISVGPGTVRIEAASSDDQAKTALANRLEAMRPDTVALTASIVAPRPVIAPFTAFFEISGESASLRCTAPDQENAQAIIAAATAAGYKGSARCRIGLGAPSADWSAVVAKAVAAVSDLGGGRVSIEDADVHLTAQEAADKQVFTDVTTALRVELPEPYVLTATLPVPEPTGDNTDDGIPRFLARKNAANRVLLSGIVLDEADQSTALAYAHAKFGAAVVDDRTRAAAYAPEGWIQRVFTAMDALELLSEGSVFVTADQIKIDGKGQVLDLEQKIRAILQNSLGPVETEIAVDEIPQPEPEASDLRDPAECEAEIAALLDGNQILFAPNSATIEPQSLKTLREIARVLNECQHVDFEIGGHTDSQGREEMNLNLSQQRAESVLDALLARRMLMGKLKAKGYGEAEPIADNETEEGRAANRRIAFEALEAEPTDEQN